VQLLQLWQLGLSLLTKRKILTSFQISSIDAAMAVDLSTNSHAMKDAYNTIVQGGATNWFVSCCRGVLVHQSFVILVELRVRPQHPRAIFGYQGKTNTLKLVESGGLRSDHVVRRCSLLAL
jgi:hypothetical protein